MAENKWTPGPWEYVASTKDHGPYVASNFGSDVCDCYAMSNPSALSVRNGGDSRPVHFLGEMADANARLIAAAPEMAEALEWLLREAENYMDAEHNQEVFNCARAALAKARP